MSKQWKFWMLASALALGVACGDDDEKPASETDAATDPVLPETDAGDEEVDAGDEEVDAGDEEVDAGDEEVDAGDEEVDAGETPDAAEPEPESIEIAGRWFGGEWDRSVLISADVFGSGAVVEFDNETNVVFTQNPADATYSPSLFNKIVWSEIADGSFYYCTIVYDGATLEDAKTRQVELDTSDPENSPCGVGSWTLLVPAIELDGEWEELAADTTHTIDSWEWASSSEFGTYANHVVEYDNENNVAYLADESVTPATYSKYVWIENTDGSFYYCWALYGQATLELAKTSDAPADESDPENSGCGATSFPWSKLTPAASN